MPGRISNIATTGREQEDQTHVLSEPDIQGCPALGVNLLTLFTILNDYRRLLYTISYLGTYAKRSNEGGCIHSMIKTQHSGRFLEKRYEAEDIYAIASCVITRSGLPPLERVPSAKYLVE